MQFHVSGGFYLVLVFQRLGVEVSGLTRPVRQNPSLFFFFPQFGFRDIMQYSHLFEESTCNMYFPDQVSAA